MLEAIGQGHSDQPASVTDTQLLTGSPSFLTKWIDVSAPCHAPSSPSELKVSFILPANIITVPAVV